MSEESEFKDLQSRYQTAVHRLDRLDGLVDTLRGQVVEKDAKIERLMTVENVVLWEKEKERTFKEFQAREVELNRQVEALTELLEAEKFAHQKTQLEAQSQIKKSEMKTERGMKLSEDEYYIHIENLRKDILRQRIQTAKQEKEKKKCLELFTGIARGLRVDLRICMEKVDHECSEILDREGAGLQGLDQLSGLMGILDDVQYGCSKETLFDTIDKLPAHYSSLEAGLRVASQPHLHSSSSSVPSSPVSSPRNRRKLPLEQKKTAKSPTGPNPRTSSTHKLPLLLRSHDGDSPSNTVKHPKRGVHHSGPLPSSVPGSPLHESVALTRMTSQGVDGGLTSPSPPASRRLLGRAAGIIPRQPRPPQLLKMGVVTPAFSLSSQQQSRRAALQNSSLMSLSMDALPQS